MKKVIVRFWKLPAIGILAVAVFLVLGAGGGISAADSASPADGLPPPVAAPWEALRDILRDAQLSLLPSEEPIIHDLGSLLLLPDGTWLPAEDPPSSCACFMFPDSSYCVTVFEDPDTRNVILRGCDGITLHEFPTEKGYSPAWVYETLVIASEARQPDTENDFPPSYDPSLVTLIATISDPFGILTLMPDGIETVPFGTGNDVAINSDALASDGTSSSDFSVFESSDFLTTQPTNAPLPAVEIPLPPDGTVYVDAKNGDDALTGRSAVIVKGDAARLDDGPKRTLSGGKSALDDGAHALVIREGSYPESLDLRGRDVIVRIEGNVKIGKAASRSLPPVEKRPDDWVDIPPSATPTNTVIRM